jgi:PAS domain S-box-containing protein
VRVTAAISSPGLEQANELDGPTGSDRRLIARGSAPVASPAAFDALLRLSATAVAISRRRDDRVVAVNDRFLRLVGCERGEVIGRTTRELGLAVVPDGESVPRALARRSAADGIETELTTPFGDRRRVVATLDVVDTDGEEWVVSQVRDVAAERNGEARLRACEARLRSVLDVAPVGIVVHDETGGIVLWNLAAERILGLSGGQLRGRTPVDSRWRAIREDGSPYAGEDHPAMVTLRTGRGCADEIMGVHRPDGELTWINIGTRPLFEGGSATPTGVVASVLDITERRRLEQILCERDTRFTLALAAGDLATWEWDVATGALQTDGFEHLAGLAPGEFDGSYESYLDLLHPDDRDRVRRADLDHVVTAGDFALEYRLVRPDGQVRWLAERGQTVARRADGTAAHVIGATVDVTGRKRIEAALRDSEAKFRGAFAAAPIGMALVSLDGRFLTVNQALCDLLGYDRSELTGIGFADVTHPDDRDRTGDFLRCVLSGEEHPLQAETRYLRKDGQIVWGMLSTSLIHDDRGRPASFIAQMVDVTRAREVERLKSEFVATVSHELRTPLTSVSGYVDLLLDGAAGELPEAADAFLTIVQSNARRLVSLINDLLDISRIEAGRLELRRMEVDLARAVGEIATSFQPQLRAKEQRLRLEIAEDAPPVWADAERVTQILANLLSNAHKYSPTGSEIVVTVQRDALGSRVEVIDHGVGMSAADQARLFEKFYRVPSSGAALETGTGLGLAITRSLVELHGGAIWVRSTPGEGSAFVFNLPAAGHDPTIGSAGQPDGVDGPSKGRLLIVEDEPDVAELLRRVLSRGGYQVTLAGSVAAALEAIALEMPDLITLDLRLPGADGRELVGWLRERLGGEAPPVLIVSILPAEDHGDELGHVDRLAKPILAAELLARVERLLGRRAAQESVRLLR